jgi:hypothetical protein
VFSLHHHPGKGHAAFTRWSRTPLGPNTDTLLACARLLTRVLPMSPCRALACPFIG